MYMSRARAVKRARGTEKREGAGDSLQKRARPFCAQTLLSGLHIEGVNPQALVLQGPAASAGYSPSRPWNHLKTIPGSPEDAAA